MTKIFIYYGPSLKFSEKIPSNYTSLSELAETLDSFRNTLRVTSSDVIESPQYEYGFSKTLVAFSEEFHGVSESFMLSFVPRLSLLEFDKIFLQNPPDRVVRQFKQMGFNIEEKVHEYKNLTKELIKKLNIKYEKYIIGQDKVKRELMLSLIPLLNNDHKPVVLMFYGPAGVGKTETAKFLSKMLGGSLFRKQFSMFQTNGYSTYLYGGSVNEDSFALDLLGRETNVILLDEFDKVDSHFHSAFYELFDEGIFTDKNYKVNMKKSIIICTSNYENEQQIKKHLGEAMYSRISSMIEFSRLNAWDKNRIINMKLEHKINFDYSDFRQVVNKKKIKDLLIENLDLMNNARDIDNTIQKLISLEILKDILSND